MKTLILLFCLSIHFFSIAQRNIPCPIIFVHGWTGDDANWSKTLQALKDNDYNITLANNRGTNKNEVGAGTGSRLDFNLNFDDDKNKSTLENDIFYYENYINPNNDVFVINFSVGNQYSNQSAIIKQGHAVGIAVQKVLNATGASEVILFGHSMGGLAIREYYQNSQHWKYSTNKVAKLITTGTPHKGSNLGSGGINISNIVAGKDETTEAVRDLRTSFAITGKQGVYLFGGYETKSYIDLAIGNYDNIDVNCNGKTGDFITGLNQRSMIDANQTEFANIIGTGTYFVSSLNSDGIVSTESANMNNLGYDRSLFYSKTYFISPNESEISTKSITWHQDLPKQSRINLRVLDEPSDFKKEYLINVNTSYSGYYNQSEGTGYYDVDVYKFEIPKKGKIWIDLSTSVSDSQIVLEDGSGGTIAYHSNRIEYEVSSPGMYRIIVGGSAKKEISQYLNKYSYRVTYCEYPENPSIISENTAFCEGNSNLISTQEGFEAYQWFRNGVKIEPRLTTPELKINQVGNYTLEAYKCGKSFVSPNKTSITILPKPQKPEIQIEDKPLQFTLKTNTTNSVGWYLNGFPIVKAVANNYVPTSFGNYTVLAINGCGTTMSDAFVVPETPKISTSKSKICVGDSVNIKANLSINTYRWYRDSVRLTDFKPEIITKIPGNYRAVLQVGKAVSIPSAAVLVKVNPIPEKPIITLVEDLENPMLKSSTNGNQWYFNGSPIAEANEELLKNLTYGNYKVKTTQRGCENTSDIFSVRALNDFAFIDKVKVYPNPSKGELKVDIPFSNYTNFRVYGINGIEYLSDEVKNFNRGKELNLNLQNGTYILRILADGKEVIRKIAIER